jgi:hypothetical protein
MVSNLPTHTSVYAVPGSDRLTLVGTIDGMVKIYKDSGNGTPGKLSENGIETGNPIVGLWQGKINDSTMMTERKLRIIALKNKKISYQIENNTPVQLSTDQNINSMWVGAWNEESTYAYASIRMFTAGDAGELTQWSIATNAAVSKTSTSTVGSTANKLTSIAGFSSINDYNLMFMCMGGSSCEQGIAWVTGEGGSLHYYASSGMGMPFTWQPVAAFVNKAGAAYQAIGAGISGQPGLGAMVSVVTAGNAGIYAEQEKTGWVGSAAGAGGFAGNTIRSISYCSNNEAWAVGHSGVVYRGVYSDTTGKMVWGQQSLIGGRDYSSTIFYAVHCSPNTGSRPQRVSVVGSNGTFLFTDYTMIPGGPGPWQAAVE